MRIYNNKGLATGGTLVGGQVVAFGNITATGRISTNEFISIGGLATAGTACGDSKLLAKSADGSGVTLSCQSGVWRAESAGVVTSYTDSCTICDRTTNLGAHKFCTLGQVGGPGGTDNDCNIYPFGGSWFMHLRDGNQSSQTQVCGAVCLD